MNGSLFEKVFLLTTIALFGFGCVSAASFFGFSDFSTFIILPFVAIAVLAMVIWDEVMCPEKMLVLDRDKLIIYSNLFAILLSFGKRIDVGDIQRLMLTEGYLTIHTASESKKPVDLWFPDEMTNDMREHILLNLPEPLAGKFINV